MKRRKKPGSHRKRRPRLALPGIMLHIDGSDRRWFCDERRQEPRVVLDDAPAKAARITDLEQANEFLRSQYIAEFNSKFTVAAAEKGTAFIRLRRKDLDWIFSSRNERTVNQDNTIQLGNRVFQLEQTHWRNPLADPKVVVP